MNSLKQAIIASLCEHPNVEKYRQRAFVENPRQMVESLAQGQSLTKADFFAPDDEGKPFIDSAGAWKNLNKIAEILQLSGDKFTYEDFTNPMVAGTSRTLLDSARANYSVLKIFTLDVWKGRFDEMEKLWYKLPTFERSRGATTLGGVVPLELKRQMLAAEGRTAPEDRLASAKLTLIDIRGATTDYAFNELNNKLRQAGDYLRKEYVLMTDGSGDTMFDGRPGSWNKYETVIKTLQAHGERLEVKDYLRQLSTTPSMLARAAEQKALNKVFAPVQWADRLPDMLTLWSSVLDAWKTSPMTTQDFDNAYAEAEGMTYAKSFKARNVNGKADLLTPLNADLNDKPVLPLGLKVVWDNFDTIQAQLSKKGESLTLADLRATSGQMEDTCLVSAAKFGCFDKVIDIAKRNGEAITMGDFLSKDDHGNTLISILAEKKQLSQVFTVEAWVGHIADMRELWSHVTAANRKQVDYAQVETGVKQATLKQKKPGNFKIPPR